MVNFVKDIDRDIKRLNTATLDLSTNLKDIRSSSGKAIRGFGDLAASLKSADTTAVKATKSLQALGLAGAGVASSLLAAVDVSAKLGALVTIGNAAYKSFKDLSGISRTLQFEEAITGTTKLADNFQYLEQTSNVAFDSIRLGLKSIFDAQGFTAFTGKAVAAYAPVEQAAYRLSTVTVASGERSVDAIGKNIASMRKLQAATKDAVGSVELLNSQYEIASAGFTAPKETQDVGKASVNLAQAGFGDLTGATNANVRVLRALGESADNADLRASQLFETTRVGLLTLDQLTPIIGSLSVQSKQLGVDFSEVTAAIAGLTTQGSSAGEAGTQLESLFAEIVNASPEANKVLAAFRDELGKPIQLNASSLKNKGLKGIIKDIQSATGGDVAKIQGLFSSKESTQAVQSLISLGDKAFGEYTDRIKNVNTDDLGKEAEGRTKTIVGAYAKAQNSSEKNVEAFGSGFGTSVVDSVLQADSAFGDFAVSSAAAVGNITGTLTGLAAKVQAVGGFISTAFSAVLPFAFFAAVTKGAGQLFAKIKASAKPGEGIWDTIQRKAIDSFADIYVKWEQMLSKLIAKTKTSADKIKKEFNAAATTPVGTQLDLFGSDKQLKSVKNKKEKIEEKDVPLNAPNTEASKIVRKNQEKKAKSVTQLDLFSAPDVSKPKGLDSLKKTFIDTKFSTISTFNSIKGAATTGMKGIGTAAKVVGPIFQQAGGMLLGIGVAGLAASAALAIGSGWVTTIGQLLDKRTNPALMQMAESLKEIKNVEGLGAVLSEFDRTTSSIESASFGMGVLNESLTRGAGLWNQLTGASYGLENQTIPQIERVNKLLDDQIAKNADAATKGKIGTTTVGGKRAEEKIARGITLGGEDESALKNEVKEKQALISARIANEELKIAEIEKNGSAEAKVGLEDKKSALKTLRQQADAEKKSLDISLEKKLVEQQISRFKNIDTSVPLQIQLAESSKQGVQAQIKEIRDTLNAKDVDILGDPSKYATEFAELSKQLSGAVDSIQVELEFNVGNAQELRKQLIDEVGPENFDKFIASNPEFRKKVTTLNAGITSGAVTGAQNEEKAQTSVFDAAQSLGSESTTLTAAKLEKQTTSINSQVKVLGEELARPETTLNRQKEIIAQIEELEAKRAALDAEGRISKELGVRKQQLTLEQQILDVKNATLSLFNQESKFGSLAITASQAKVQAAQQELKFKKESLAIEGKEIVIKKEAVAKSLEKKQDREIGQANAGLAGVNLSDPNLKKSLEAKASQFSTAEQQRADQAKAANEADAKNKSEEIAKKARTFSKEEQAKIVESETRARLGGDDGQTIVGDLGLREKIRKRTFNDDGTIKDEDAVRQRAIDNGSSGNFDFAKASRDANEVFLSKENDAAKQRFDLKTGNAADNARIDKTAESNISNRQGIFDALKKRAEQAGGSASNLSGVIGEKSGTSTSTEATAKEGEITAQSDVAFAKAVESIKNRLGSMAQRIALNEAKIQQEFASREKLIKRGELLGESLSALANKSDIFGDSVAGAQLQLQALQTTNSSGKLQAEADKEIASINQKVKDLAQNAIDAAAAASEARAAGADDKTIARLDNQATDASKLSQTANKEKDGDIAFVKQATSLAKLSAALDINVAAINAEFIGREKLSKQTAAVADGFSQLAGTTLLQNSAAGASLKFTEAGIRSKDKGVNVEADKKIAQINSRIETLTQLAKEPGEVGAKAKTQLETAKQEAGTDIQAVNNTRAFGLIESDFATSSAALEKETASRDRLIERNDSLASSFSSIASTLSGLFSNSSIGASLSKFSAQLNVSNNKSGKEYQKQAKLLDERSTQLAKAVQTAKDSGASDDVVQGLQQAQAEDAKQKPLEKAYLRQKGQLDGLNDRLAVMAAGVQEVSDRLSKQAAVIKEGIELEDRKRASAADNNKSGVGLQSALVGFLGKNNPVAQQLQQRLEIQQGRDDAVNQQATNVSDAKKEIIDTTVLKSQLDLELKSYENAITQTALLSDLVSVSQGGSATSSASGEIKKQLAQLPQLLAAGRAQAAQRGSLLDDKLKFIPQELEGKQASTKRNLLASELGTLGGKLNPANIDLLTRTLGETENQVKGFKRQDVNVGSLQDKAFQDQLARLGGTKIPAPQRNESLVNNRIGNGLPTANANTRGGQVSINSPITIKIDASGNGGDTSKLNAMIKENTTRQVNEGMNKLSDKVLQYSKQF